MLARNPAPPIPTGPSTVRRPCVVLSAPWVRTRSPGDLVAPEITPERPLAALSAAPVGDRLTPASASGFHAVNRPAE